MKSTTASLPRPGGGVDPEKHDIRRLGVRHHAMDDPGISVDIATREGKQQRNLHRFLAAHRRTGGDIH